MTTIDLSGVTSARELHALLKRELDFPDFYGHNWDAFHDAITGLVELPKSLTFTGWAALEKTLPRDAAIMRRVLDEYAEHHRGKPAWEITVTYR